MNYSPELRQVVLPLGKAAGAGDNMLVWPASIFTSSPPSVCSNEASLLKMEA